MGGLVAVDFADNYPKQVKSLSLIAPAGLPFETPGVAKLLKAPYAGEYILKSFGEFVLGGDQSFVKKENAHLFRKGFEQQFPIKGYKDALLSATEHIPLKGLKQSYESVGRKSIPSLLIWGKQDNVVPYQTSKLVIETIPNIDFYDFDGVGHMPNMEIPNEVSKLIINHVNQTRAPDKTGST